MKPRGMQGPPAIGQGFVLARRVAAGPNLEGAAGQPTDCRASMHTWVECGEHVQRAQVVNGRVLSPRILSPRGIRNGPWAVFPRQGGLLLRSCLRRLCIDQGRARRTPCTSREQGMACSEWCRRWRTHSARTLRSAASEAPQQSGTPVGAGAGARCACARRFRTMVSTMLRRSASKRLHCITEKKRCWARAGRGLAKGCLNLNLRL